MTTRRDFLIGTAAITSMTGISARAATGADGKAQAALADMAEQMLADYPESATGLGLDKDKRAALKSQLTDRSGPGQMLKAYIA